MCFILQRITRHAMECTMRLLYYTQHWLYLYSTWKLQIVIHIRAKIHNVKRKNFELFHVYIVASIIFFTPLFFTCVCMRMNNVRQKERERESLYIPFQRTTIIDVCVIILLAVLFLSFFLQCKIFSCVHGRRNISRIYFEWFKCSRKNRNTEVKKV